jgi:hypothetical protein
MTLEIQVLTLDFGLWTRMFVLFMYYAFCRFL